MARDSADAGCLGFLPPNDAHLGGPLTLLLDESLEVLAGRRLDRLVRETDDGGWPEVSADPGAARLTIVVE